MIQSFGGRNFWRKSSQQKLTDKKLIVKSPKIIANYVSTFIGHMELLSTTAVHG